jgi:hypothetical protein
LLEPPVREALLDRAAGCVARLGTDGLVVLIFLPIREVILGLILRKESLELLLVLLVERFVITLLELLKFKLLLLELLRFNLLLLKLLTLDVPLLEVSTGRLAVLLFVIALLELLLLDGVLVVILLPIREVMLELILPFELLRLVELGTEVRELIDRLDARLVITLLELGLEVLELIDGLDILLLGVLLVILLLELLLLEVMLLLTLGARLVIDLLDVLLLGVRLEELLLELLLLGVLLIVGRLELRLDETFLEGLEDDLLDEDRLAEDDLEDDRLDPRDLLLLERDLAANTGSQNNKSAKNTQKTSKKEPFRVLYPDSCILYSVFFFLFNIIRLLSSALTYSLLFHTIKGNR